MSPFMEALLYVLLVAALLLIAGLGWAFAHFTVVLVREVRAERARGEHLPPEYRTPDRERAGLMRGDTTHPTERTR